MGLLAKREVKMAGYWLNSLFACLWTMMESRSINSQKRMSQISSHLDETGLANRGFFIWVLRNFFSWDTVDSYKQARKVHMLPSKIYINRESELALENKQLPLQHLFFGMTSQWT